MTDTNLMAQRSLEDLLKDLETAVSLRDRARATLLEQEILRRLVAKKDELDRMEMRVRALMAQLESPPVLPPPIIRTPVAFPTALAPTAVVPPPTRSTKFSLDSELSAKRGKKDAATYSVWFGTNRKQSADGNGFTAERSNTVTRGRVDVQVPDAHKFGEIGTSFLTRLRRTTLKTIDLRDDRLRVKDILISPDAAAFFAELQQRMGERRTEGGSPQAVLFLHGYNNSFEDAAIRAAQMGVDLKVQGAMAFFSWPSQNDAGAYPVDEAAIEASEGAITEFLVDFVQQSGADKVHLIAHSMGNRGLLRALQRIAGQAERQGKVKFGQIVLAAPDLDRDLFLDLAYLYPKYGERVTLYASSADLPVHLSSKFHGAARAGYFAPYTVAPNIDTVCVPDFDIDLLGHSYFAQAEALLNDIFALMTTTATVKDRQRIASFEADGQKCWQIKR